MMVMMITTIIIEKLNKSNFSLGFLKNRLACNPNMDYSLITQMTPCLETEDKKLFNLDCLSFYTMLKLD